jgi:hypothetical protein
LIAEVVDHCAHVVVSVYDCSKSHTCIILALFLWLISIVLLCLAVSE